MKDLKQIHKEFWKTVREVNVEDIKSETIYLVSDDDITNLITLVQNREREKIAEEIKGLVSKDNDYQKNSGIYEAHDLVKGI